MNTTNLIDLTLAELNQLLSNNLAQIGQLEVQKQELIVGVHYITKVISEKPKTTNLPELKKIILPRKA